MHYDIPLKHLPKTSPRTISRLTTAGINSIGDLLETVPFRYEDYRSIIPIANINTLDNNLDEPENTLLSKGKVTVQGIIEKKTNIFTRRGFSMQKLTVSDESGSTMITWFNQPFLLRLFREGERISIAGSIRNSNGVVQLQPENYEMIAENLPTIHTARIVPIYSSVPGVSTRTLREKMYHAVTLYGNTTTECLPDEIIKRSELVDMSRVFSHLHFPDSVELLTSARQRMSFNELFSIQLKMQLIRKEWRSQHVDEPMSADKNSLIQDFIGKLPYELTNAQKRVADEILTDMSSKQPMNRLLQGDVGSGKTVVTFIAALFAYYNSKKVLYMAPTEILAQQHHHTLSSLSALLPPDKRPSICLMTNNSRPTDDEFAHADIIVGTHALITSKKTITHIGLVIVDEQHKFGVMQRGALKKKGISPHMLSLTATPIPRTVMLTLYGELDISIIDEFPKGRMPIKTYVTPEHKRSKAYEWITKELKEHHQVFIVCPFIEQSDIETLQSVKAASEEIKRIETVFRGYSTKLLHGKLKPQEKELIMKSFSEGKIDILVSTPVVEVGIDVPNATIIVIEGAERFGLAQLHQLRGRVGRSELQSHCLLFTTSTTSAVGQRLSFFARTHDGFELARYDLSRRGGGNIFGTQQHGYSPIALETLLDTKLIEQVQHASTTFLESGYDYKNFPYLVKRLHSFSYEEIAHN